MCHGNSVLVMSQAHHCLQYLEKNGIGDLSRDNFTFSTKVCVGEFYEAVVTSETHGYVSIITLISFDIPFVQVLNAIPPSFSYCLVWLSILYFLQPLLKQCRADSLYFTIKYCMVLLISLVKDTIFLLKSMVHSMWLQDCTLWCRKTALYGIVRLHSMW